MPRHPRRALLIGVAAYDDTSIDSLPFIADDLDDLERALDSIGYQVDRHPPQHGDRDRIDTAIEQFCRRAQPGQQLLIFLSGHGIHRDGRDYLLPSSADTTSRKFTERCLEIEFTGHIEDSRCGDVLVVVDACREGVRLQEKSGYSYVHRWSRQQRARSAGRTVAYLYACSSGELARWKETPDGTFSLFTRAFSRALTDPSVPATLTGVSEAVHTRLDTLSAELGAPPQRPHLDGDVDRCSRMLLADRAVHTPASRGAAGWADRARTHAVWDLVHSQPNTTGLSGPAEALREATVGCVATWSREYQRQRDSLGDDPWWDDELATRMHDRLSWIVKHLLNPAKLVEADKPPLTAAEAALLVLLPFAQQLHRATAAVTSRSVLDAPDPADEQSAEFGRYIEGRRRIVRRLRRLEGRGDHAHTQALRWAAYHRWLAQRPQLYRTGVVADSLLTPLAPPDGAAAALLREVISADRLVRLLRALRSDPEAVGSVEPVTGTLGGTDLPAGAQTVAGGSPDEQTVRDRLLALILLVAEEFTIDATVLPSIVTDHLGLQDGVEPGEVLRAVQGARWPARGRIRVLEADCPHQSVQLALTEHTDRISEVLRRVDAAAEADRTLEALRDLPTHVAPDGLRPLSGPDGSPRYDMVGFRFRLDSDRVQELLMGEQLYGDPALAVRELYQNALDACRYRRARTEYLGKQGRPPAAWEGRISFTQGVDEDGRSWLECRDNGIGMSERELNSVFSHAGVRFADLPEFLEEQAIWEKEDITFYPNSRFGIGVLSYFMLGDEIEVSTARFSRNGVTAARLRVDIDGPGSLCRIRTVGGDPESGTTIRIYLRPSISISCTDLLASVLWVAEFPVTAANETATLQWEPGVLSPHASVNDADITDSDPDLYHNEPGLIAERVLPSSTPHVWWCDGPGAVLADGLWAGENRFGYVIDLVGPAAPRLTVDRRRILSLDQARVHRMLQVALPDLFAPKAEPRTLRWLWKFARNHIDLADEIGRRMIDGGAELAALHGVNVKTALVGVFPPDDSLFNVSEELLYEGMNQRHSYLPFAKWRLYRYLAVGCVPGVELAGALPAAELPLPSDAILLSRRSDGDSPWIDLSRPIGVAPIFAASIRLNRSPRLLAARLVDLGFQTAEFVWPDVTAHEDDLRLLSAGLDREPPWLDPSEPVPAAHVLMASAVLGRPTSGVLERLSDLGRAAVEPATTSSPSEAPQNRLLLSCDLDGLPPWLTRSEPVPPDHVMAAAAELEWPPRQVADRLAEFGLLVPDLAWPATSIGDTDLRLLSWGLDGKGPWLQWSEPVPLRHVLFCAAQFHWSFQHASERIAALGLRLPDHSWPDIVASEDDRALLQFYEKSVDDQHIATSVVPAVNIFVIATWAGSTPHSVAGQLGRFGLPVTEYAYPELPVFEADRLLLSADLDGIEPWLDLTESISSSHVLAAASVIGQSPRQIAGRLAELGLQVDAYDWPDLLLEDDDRLLLSASLDGRRPWLDGSQYVPAGHIVIAAAALEGLPSQMAERLRMLGLAFVLEADPPSPLRDDDRLLLSVNQNGRSPWLRPAEEVSLQHVLSAAAVLRLPARYVAARLTALGLRVAYHPWPDIDISGDDQQLLSRDLDRQGPWLDPAQPVGVRHVLEAAETLRSSPRQVALRLVELGLTVPETDWPDTTVASEDLRLVTDHLPPSKTWLTLREETVDPGILVPGLHERHMSVAEAALRIKRLGFELPAEIKIVLDTSPKLKKPRRWSNRLADEV